MEKVVFDPWQQVTWDSNDTVQIHPLEDEQVGPFCQRLPLGEWSPTWYEQRMALPQDGELAKQGGAGKQRKALRLTLKLRQ